MFADPFTAIMALVLLSFVGTLVLFFFIARSLETVQRSVHEARGNLQTRLADTERQLNDLAAAVRELVSTRDPAVSKSDPPEDLGEILEKGLRNLGRQDGLSLRERNLPERVASTTPIGSKNAGSGSLDIL